MKNGICKDCGVPYWQDEHDHKGFGTLSPEAALKSWQEKRAKEEEAAENAAKPWQ